MKILKIENNSGYYLNGENFSSIDKINKEDLLYLVDLTLNEDVEFDEYDSETLKNQAHQVIYRSVVEKLTDLNRRKDEFKDEIDRQYLEDYEKYKKSTVSIEESKQ